MTCCKPSSHIIDSEFYQDGYSTPESREIFCAHQRYQRWLDIEAALASAQAELGIIPEAAALAINEKASLQYLSLSEVRDGIKETSHSLVPLLRAWKKICPGGTGQFIHFGATTQDIQDTGQVLEMLAIITLVERDLDITLTQLTDLAEQHIDLVMVGRTHAQQALPITLGYKISIWIDELIRHRTRLAAMKEQVSVSQLFGGVGTMDALGEQAFALIDNFSARLGLKAPQTAWHAARDRMAEYLTTFALIAGTLAKIGNEIRCLSRNETGEMEEPFSMGKVGSSTMPHKRNPEMCEKVVVLSKLIKSHASLAIEAIVNEHERDFCVVRMEWVTLADASHYLCCQFAFMKNILSGLRIYPEQIQKNLQHAAPSLCSEALMFFLGKSLGKHAAHDIVYTTSMHAIESGRPLIDLLVEHPEVAGKFQAKTLQKVIDPGNHIGLSQQMTQRIIAHVRNLNLLTMETGQQNISRCSLRRGDRCACKG